MELPYCGVNDVVSVIVGGPNNRVIEVVGQGQIMSPKGPGPQVFIC